MSFKISDKVVCVDDVPRNGRWAHIYPNGVIAKGQIYCVEGYGFPECLRTKELRLFLAGKQVIGIKTGKQLGFAAWRFRKLDELKAEAKACYQDALPARQTPSPFHQEQPIKTKILTCHYTASK